MKFLAKLEGRVPESPVNDPYYYSYDIRKVLEYYVTRYVHCYYHQFNEVSIKCILPTLFYVKKKKKKAMISVTSVICD